MDHRRLLWLALSFFLRLNAQTESPLSALKETTINDQESQAPSEDLTKEEPKLEKIAPIHPVCTSSVI